MCRRCDDLNRAAEFTGWARRIAGGASDMVYAHDQWSDFVAASATDGVPPFDLEAPRYDQSTYTGRLNHFREMTDIRLVLTSEAELKDAVDKLAKFKTVRITIRIRARRAMHLSSSTTLGAWASVACLVGLVASDSRPHLTIHAAGTHWQPALHTQDASSYASY